MTPEPASPTAAATQAYPLRFTASGSEYFRIWIVNLLLIVPWLVWSVRRYQHDHYGLGPLRTRLHVGPGAVYGVMLATFGIAIGTVLALGLVVALATAAVGAGTRGRGPGAGAVLFVLLPFLLVAFGVLFNALVIAHAQSRLQNLLGSRTGNRMLRFRSVLHLGPFFRLQFKNFLLIALTAGLYWPFAVGATRRVRLESVALHSRAPLDALAQQAQQGNPGAVGDMAADLFGLDFGM